jgi:hypothetical protein
MSPGAGLILYIGTVDSLFKASSTVNEYSTSRLELNGSGAIRCPVVMDRINPQPIFAATSKQGVLRSDNGGGTWSDINEGILYKEAWSLAQHPKTVDLYVGAGPSAMFKGTDRGDTWSDWEQLRSLPEPV